MTLIQQEPKSIKLGIPHDDYSAMQGPAPSGFHVPLTTERQAVYDIWTALGGGSSDGPNFGIALKLPFAGGRYYSSGSVYNQGAGGLYWSSSRFSENNAYYLNFHSSALNPQSYGYRAYGCSVRCFKNTPIIPTLSWTKLYGTSIEAGGIFWSSTDGLISLSSNGTTWITIMDKNLGATQVWNSGDTLSEANCGKYYQRGNNYGFPFTGSVTTSSTKVDASNYGPGNYYSSSTFITVSSIPYRWDTTDNGNLWGGVTGVVQKTDTDIKKVYLGSTQVRPRPVNFATQGPAPDGFHVPLSSEWGALCGILTTTFGLASTAATMQTYLKMSMAGYRSSNSNASGQGSYGFYWAASHYDTGRAYILYFLSSYIIPQNATVCITGSPVRCFKNSSVTPNSSWTTLYDGSSVATGAGVFRNSSLGLISVSGDGATWITIQDKNLGATTVYNSGDTLSESNCGKYYQWGNNYGFPFTGSVTTSSTQVNAGTYGPGNYYSSSTFITTNPRDTTDNANLRGGEDGNVPV